MVNLNPTTTFWTNCVVFNWNPEGRPLLDMSVIFFAGVLLTVGLKEGKPPFWEFPPPPLFTHDVRCWRAFKGIRLRGVHVVLN